MSDFFGQALVTAVFVAIFVPAIFRLIGFSNKTAIILGLVSLSLGVIFQSPPNESPAFWMGGIAGLLAAYAIEYFRDLGR